MKKERLHVWKSVPGYEGYYEVSDYGNVRSLDRLVKCNKGNRLVKGRILDTRVNLDKRGVRTYKSVTVELTKFSKLKHFIVARLVLLAFKGIPDSSGEAFQARHLDSDSLNNHLSNLVWGTPQENSDDRAKVGRALFSPEAREYLSKVTKGRVFAEEHLANLKIARAKRPPTSEETKKRISQGAKNRKRRPHTLETRAKMSQSGKLAWKSRYEVINGLLSD